MKPRSTVQILDAVVDENISVAIDLAPKILAKIRSEKRKIMKPGMKLVSTLLLVLLALLTITSIAYAVYRLNFGDAGLQSVQNAGLETNLNVTAQPTLLPTPTPPIEPQEPVALGISQTRSGVTLVLDWIYIDEASVGLGMSFTNMPQGFELGAPDIDFSGVLPAQKRGWTERLNTSTGHAEYISYQVIHASDVNGMMTLTIDIPLLQKNGNQQVTLDNFHFDLTNIPIFQRQGLPLQQTYGVKVNGLEIRLESVRATGSSIETVLCYDDATLGVQSAVLQVDGGLEKGFETATVLDPLTEGKCIDLTFPVSDISKIGYLLVRVNELSAVQNPDNKLVGPWEFHVDLPDRSAFPGQASTTSAATPVPLGAQSLDNVTVTLDWAFVDARRVAVGYTIRGLPDLPDATGVSGTIGLKNTQGEYLGGAGIGSSSINRVAGQPGVLQGTWSVGFSEPLTQSEASFVLDITLDGSQKENVLGYFSIAPDATPYPPGIFPPVLPDRLIGTYTFEFTAPVHPLQTLETIPPVSANGIEVYIPHLEITASLTEAILCYDKPSAEDWWVMSATLENASGDTASISGGSLLYDSNFTLPEKSKQNQTWLLPTEIQSAQNGRCVKINFLLGHGNRSGPITLSISQLELSGPEVVPDDQIRAAQEKLKLQGIEMDYSSMSSGNGGGSGPRFTHLPEGMSQEEAYHRYQEALGYLYPGPWVFTFNVNP